MPAADRNTQLREILRSIPKWVFIKTPAGASQTLCDLVLLERAMLILDARDPEMADLIRDRIDPLWYALEDHEREWLNGRSPQVLR
jgi:hypothetical protein